LPTSAVFEFHRDKRDVLVVSSGAIALGRAVLKLPAGPLKLETRIGIGRTRCAGVAARPLQESY
jgi:glutamate 5-kinase